MLKLSIVISVFESYEIVRRQLLHFSKIQSDDFEVIIVDDGSNPPIKGASYQTGNNLAWTQGLGRNLGASKAKGEYLFMTDIDHIISRKSIDDALRFTGNKMIFRRQIAVLDDSGDVVQDRKTLNDWGYFRETLDASVHGNTFVIRKDIFEKLGGYSEGTCTKGYHPVSKQGDDCHFNSKWNRAYRGEKPAVGSDIYLFPLGRWREDGDLNPKGLFHNLSQTSQEKMYKYA